MERKKTERINSAAQSWFFRWIFLIIFIAGGIHETSLAQEIRDEGNFILEFGSTEDPAESQYRQYLIDEGSLDAVVQDMNCELNLRENVRVTFRTSDSGSNNPLYDAEYNQILISYGFVIEVSSLFRGDANAWFPNVVQIVLHEMGHALMDVNKIEQYYDGENNEVLADQLAFFVMSEFYEADDALQQVAEHFDIRSVDRNVLSATSGDHLPDSERATQFICWIEGKRHFMADRYGGCRGEYEALLDSWDDRLAPSWKAAFAFESREDDEYDEYECDEPG